MPGRYDQDLRFGSANLKSTFWLVKFLEDVGYEGPRHFDAHAYRTEDCAGVKDFARGCMRTYLILKEKAERMRDDAEIQEALRVAKADRLAEPTGPLDAVRAASVDEDALAAQGYGHERLDQLVTELLLGVR